MRIAVTILALLGSLCAGFLGLTWLGDARSKAGEIRQMEQLASQIEQGSSAGLLGGDHLATLKSSLAKIRNARRASWLLLLGAAASGTCGVLLLLHKLPPRPAAITLLASSLLPALFVPISLVFSFLLLVAGGLGFLVRETELPAMA
jgi:hypothetical protein